jgi:hypothetical protein
MSDCKQTFQGSHMTKRLLAAEKANRQCRGVSKNTTVEMYFLSSGADLA